MTYFSAMGAVLKSDASIYSDIEPKQKAMRYCVLNISIAGGLHALFSSHFAAGLLEKTASASLVPGTAVVLVVTGVTIAFLMHVGAILLLWTFGRGLGGKPYCFLPLYRNLGVAFIGLWPATPLLAAVQSGDDTLPVRVLLILSLIYAAGIGFVAVKSAFGLSTPRMIAAVTTTTVFVASLLYLWL